jgi:hypothetical protein
MHARTHAAKRIPCWKLVMHAVPMPVTVTQVTAAARAHVCAPSSTPGMRVCSVSAAVVSLRQWCTHVAYMRLT